jgi:hypothetical protein
MTKAFNLFEEYAEAREASAARKEKIFAGVCPKLVPWRKRRTIAEEKMCAGCAGCPMLASCVKAAAIIALNELPEKFWEMERTGICLDMDTSGEDLMNLTCDLLSALMVSPDSEVISISERVSRLASMFN